MSSTTLVPYRSEQRQWLEVMSPAADLAKQIAGTDFVPKSLRNNPAAIAAAILFGDEVGFGPMQSLAKIAVIDGKPALAAEAQRALILRAGHDLWIEEATTTKVTMAGRRKGSDQVTRITWTLDDAKRANLAGRPSWRNYPRQMLTARATAELARAVFADAIGGLAAIEELEEPVEGEVGNGVEPDTTKRTTRKRTKTALAPVPPSDPDPAPAAPGPPLPGEEDEAATLSDVENHGGASQALDQGGVSPPLESPDDAPPDSAEPLTLEELNRKMDAIVATLRRQEKLRTEHLWSAMATERGVDVTQMIALLHGYDSEGVLHWSPLRDSLDLEEAQMLHGRLARLWVNTNAELEVVT